MNAFRPTLAAIAVAACLAAAPVPAAESFDSCKGTITTLPAVISTPGTWCLAADEATAVSSGSAIHIATSNVTIDCNGFRISGLAAGAGTAANGVTASGKFNVGLRNCHVRGFKSGIEASGTAFLVENNRFEGNTQRGISIAGDAHIVRGNQVLDTGGSTLGAGVAFGIYAFGSSEVSGNHVSGVTARAGSGQGVWGIRLGDQDGPAQIVAADNSVRNLAPDGAGVGTGIRTSSTGRVSLRDNAVFGSGSGIGLQCANAGGAVRGNSILGFATAISGCSSDGGNVVKP